jgi:hypothetical protein
MILKLLRFAVMLPVLAGSGWAQEYDGIDRDLFAPGLVRRARGVERKPQGDPLAKPVPYSPPIDLPEVPFQNATQPLALEARLTSESAPLAEGVIWRVFGPQPRGTASCRCWLRRAAEPRMSSFRRAIT